MTDNGMHISDIGEVEAAPDGMVIIDATTDDSRVLIQTGKLTMSRETAKAMATQLTYALQGTVKPFVDDATLRRWLRRRVDRRRAQSGEEPWDDDMMNEWLGMLLEVARQGGVFTPADVEMERAADVAEGFAS